MPSLRTLRRRQRLIDEKHFTDRKKTVSPYYWGLALNGEVGELSNVIKKYLRNFEIDKETRSNAPKLVAEECADIVIYLFIVCDTYCFALSDDPTLIDPDLSLETVTNNIGILCGKLQHVFTAIAEFNLRHPSLSVMTGATQVLWLKIEQCGSILCDEMMSCLYHVANYFSFDLLTEVGAKQIHNWQRFGKDPEPQKDKS